MELMLDNHIKATFAAGLVPTQVEDLHYSEDWLRVDRIHTSLIMRWLVSHRHIYLKYSNAAVAIKAQSALETEGYRARRSVVTPTTAIVTVSPIHRSVTPNQIVALLPPNFRPASETDVKDEKSDWMDRSLGRPFVKDLVRERTGRTPVSADWLPPQRDLERRIKINFEGCGRLDGVARRMEGHTIKDWAPVTIEAREMVKVDMRLRAVVYAACLGGLRRVLKRLRAEMTVEVADFGLAGREEVRVVIAGFSRSALRAAKRSLDEVVVSQWSSDPETAHLRDSARLAQFASILSHDKWIEADEPDVDDVFEFNCGFVKAANSRATSSINATNTPRRDTTGSKTCKICWESTTSFTACGTCSEIACTDCFAQYCTTNASAPPLRCFGPNCDIPLPLSQIRRVLGETQFHALASAAVKAYYQQHPRDYLPCPGPECTAYYPLRGPNEHTCPSCFIVACPVCKVEYHYGEDCAAYQARTDPNASIQKYINDSGAKRCPKCQNVIEKAPGCNHMTCVYCRQHFCWLCLECFDKASDVYDHMNDKHGGFYDDAAAQAAANDEVLEGYRRQGGGWVPAGAPEPDFNPFFGFPLMAGGAVGQGGGNGVGDQVAMMPQVPLMQQMRHMPPMPHMQQMPQMPQVPQVPQQGMLGFANPDPGGVTDEEERIDEVMEQMALDDPRAQEGVDGNDEDTLPPDGGLPMERDYFADEEMMEGGEFREAEDFSDEDEEGDGEEEGDSPAEAELPADDDLPPIEALPPAVDEGELPDGPVRIDRIDFRGEDPDAPDSERSKSKL